MAGLDLPKAIPGISSNNPALSYARDRQAARSAAADVSTQRQQQLEQGRRKELGQTMAADIAQTTSDPAYRLKPYEDLDADTRQSYFDGYGAAAADLPQAWNQAQTAQKPVIPGLQLHSASVGDDGKVTRNFAQADLTPPGQITEKDVADAGIDPSEIPRSQWPSAVAKAKSGREGKLTEMQSNALQYSARMGYQRGILDRLESRGFNPAALDTGIGGMLPNLMQSKDMQVYKAARDNWVSAVLRKESGAAISKSEYENAYKQYFPQIGDDPAVMQQKKELRKIAEDNMKLVAGGRASEAETGSPQQQGPPTVNSQQEYDALPSGTPYVDSSGRQAVKR